MATAFDNLAPQVMRNLIADFGLTVEQAAGIVGNLGAESGLRAINESHPTVPGSRGGFGWAQWTDRRRVSFEKFARDRNLLFDSFEANYGYLRGELSGSVPGFDYTHTITQIKKTTTPEASAQTFEADYEQAGIINMTSRVAFAKRAMALYQASSLSKPAGKEVSMPPAVTLPDTTSKPWYQSKAVIGGIISIVLPILSVAFPALKIIPAEGYTDIALKILPILGGILAIFGRVSATQPISGTKSADIAAGQSASGDLSQSMMSLPLNTIIQELPLVLGALSQLPRAMGAAGGEFGAEKPVQGGVP